MTGVPRKLSTLMRSSRGSVDPSRFSKETFELYSIPAYDAGSPEILQGKEIGSAKQIVEPNDVLISKIVPHIRRAWIVGADKGFRQIASGEWIVFRNEDVHPSYLRHFLLSDGFHGQFMRTVSGVGGSLKRAKPRLVGEISVELPGLTEQKRIAEILDAAEWLRDRHLAAAKKASELRDALASGYFEQ